MNDQIQQIEQTCMRYVLYGFDPLNYVISKDILSEQNLINKIKEIQTEINQITTKEEIFNSSFFNKYKVEQDETDLKLENRNKEATGRPCPRCKTKMFELSKQTRSGDEGTTHMEKCPACNYTKREG